MMNDAPNGMAPLLDFLGRLGRHRIHFTLGHVRDETVRVTVAVPGERWEVEFFADGSTEVEVFRSAGNVLGGEQGRAEPERLFRDFGDGQ